MAVGDIMMGDSSHFMGRGVGTAVRARGADSLFVKVRDLITRSDLFVFNLESPLSSDDGMDYRTKVYRGPANACLVSPVGWHQCRIIGEQSYPATWTAVLQETRSLLEKDGIAGVGFSATGDES